MSVQQKIRVCIRGMSGLLGNRLALAIQKQPDIEVTVGIVKNDRTLDRILNGRWTKDMLPEHMYLDESHTVVRAINQSQSLIIFEPADQLCLANLCDIVVDTTSPNSKNKWNERYAHFGKPVLLQSGEYPKGRLIAPPLIEDKKTEGNIFRQGDCIMSALSPILAPFSDIASGIRLNVLMQYGNPLNDYPTNQRINSTYLADDLAKQIETELQHLFPDKEVLMEGLLQVPGIDYYTITLHLDSSIALSGRDVKEMLRNRPRILIASEGITSTYQIDHHLREEERAFGRDIPPIVIYSNDLIDNQPKNKDIRIRATVYSRLIAVFPNIDAIRILAKSADPLTSMRTTDQYAGFYCK